MRLATFSRVGQAMACEGSVALPQVQTDSTHARSGRVRHSFVSRVINVGRKAALADATPEQRAELEAMELETLIGFFAGCAPVRSEVAFAFDPERDAARELGENIDRQYEKAGADMAREICGALDLHALVIGEDEVRIVDMKGRGKGDPWQLKAQAISAARRYGVDKATVIFAHHQPDGSFRWSDKATYEALDLDEIAGDLRGMKARARAAHAVAAAGRIPNVAEGDHCTYCPALRYCPAKTAIIRAATAETLDIAAKVGALTPAERAAAWVKMKTIKPLVEALEKALKEQAAAEPIDLGNGKEVRAFPGNDQIDSEIGLDVLTKTYGAEAAAAAASRKLTKSGIEKALGGDAERAIDLIRDAGGITSGNPIVKEAKSPKKAKFINIITPDGPERLVLE